jgi:hypothetical protein
MSKGSISKNKKSDARKRHKEKRERRRFGGKKKMRSGRNFTIMLSFYILNVKIE